MILYNYVIYCKDVTNIYINDCNEFFIQVCFIQNLHSVFVRSFIIMNVTNIMQLCLKIVAHIVHIDKQNEITCSNMVKS